MFLGNLPVKYNSEGVGATTNTPPVNANPVNQTFVEESGSNLPPDPIVNGDIVAPEDNVNTNLDVNANKIQPYFVVIAALLIGLLVYRSLKKERSSQ
jgi:hypothetical protein